MRFCNGLSDVSSVLNDLAEFPITFKLDGKSYRGFSCEFTEKQRTVKKLNEKTLHTIVLSYNELEVEIEFSVYESYSAFDYKVTFKNCSKTALSPVISDLCALDINNRGAAPVLSGINGDHVNNYSPYSHNLCEKNVMFCCSLGRPTHIYFPYFNLCNESGGVMLALGWAGTWRADFEYQPDEQYTNVKFWGTITLNTYLKPGESVRTPLIAGVFYDLQDERGAQNAWRKWVIDCVMPRENEGSKQPVQPFTTCSLHLDTGRFNSDGSISEDYTTYKPSLDSFAQHGLSADFRWLDAGWYFDPAGRSQDVDWHFTVGSLEVDSNKWPKNTLKESVDYARSLGMKTLMWFEPERVTDLDSMIRRHGYKKEWAIKTDKIKKLDERLSGCDREKWCVYLDEQTTELYIPNDIGEPECLDWTVNHIINVLEQNDIDMFRLDFNYDKALYFDYKDNKLGENRRGITEQKNVTGYYRMLDRIIEYCRSKNKCNFIDSCASGGGRNDLETLKRAVPMLRSDRDRTTVSLRLAFTTRLSPWLPFNGAVAKENDDEKALGLGNTDIYVMRATYLCHMGLVHSWHYKKDEINWDVLKQGVCEWNSIKDYFLKDFYVLTPQREIEDDKNWTAFEYFDGDNGKGVVQAFRPDNCTEPALSIKIKGLNKNKAYSIRDFDGVNSADCILGSELSEGFTLVAKAPRTAIVLEIKELPLAL